MYPRLLFGPYQCPRLLPGHSAPQPRPRPWFTCFGDRLHTASVYAYGGSATVFDRPSFLFFRLGQTFFFPLPLPYPRTPIGAFTLICASVPCFGLLALRPISTLRSSLDVSLGLCLRLLSGWPYGPCPATLLFLSPVRIRALSSLVARAVPASWPLSHALHVQLPPLGSVAPCCLILFARNPFSGDRHARPLQPRVLRGPVGSALPSAPPPPTCSSPHFLRPVHIRSLLFPFFPPGGRCMRLCGSLASICLVSPSFFHLFASCGSGSALCLAFRLCSSSFFLFVAMPPPAPFASHVSVVPVHWLSAPFWPVSVLFFDRSPGLLLFSHWPPFLPSQARICGVVCSLASPASSLCPPRALSRTGGSWSSLWPSVDSPLLSRCPLGRAFSSPHRGRPAPHFGGLLLLAFLLVFRFGHLVFGCSAGLAFASSVPPALLCGFSLRLWFLAVPVWSVCPRRRFFRRPCLVLYLSCGSPLVALRGPAPCLPGVAVFGVAFLSPPGRIAAGLPPPRPPPRRALPFFALFAVAFLFVAACLSVPPRCVPVPLLGLLLPFGLFLRRWVGSGIFLFPVLIWFALSPRAVFLLLAAFAAVGPVSRPRARIVRLSAARWGVRLQFSSPGRVCFRCSGALSPPVVSLVGRCSLGCPWAFLAPGKRPPAPHQLRCFAAGLSQPPRPARSFSLLGFAAECLFPPLGPRYALFELILCLTGLFSSRLRSHRGGRLESPLPFGRLLWACSFPRAFASWVRTVFLAPLSHVIASRGLFRLLLLLGLSSCPISVGFLLTSFPVDPLLLHAVVALRYVRGSRSCRALGGSPVWLAVLVCPAPPWLSPSLRPSVLRGRRGGRLLAARALAVFSSRLPPSVALGCAASPGSLPPAGFALPVFWLSCPSRLFLRLARLWLVPWFGLWSSSRLRVLCSASAFLGPSSSIFALSACFVSRGSRSGLLLLGVGWALPARPLFFGLPCASSWFPSVRCASLRGRLVVGLARSSLPLNLPLVGVLLFVGLLRFGTLGAPVGVPLGRSRAAPSLSALLVWSLLVFCCWLAGDPRRPVGVLALARCSPLLPVISGFRLGVASLRLPIPLGRTLACSLFLFRSFFLHASTPWRVVSSGFLYRFTLARCASLVCWCSCRLISRSCLGRFVAAGLFLPAFLGCCLPGIVPSLPLPLPSFLRFLCFSSHLWPTPPWHAVAPRGPRVGLLVLRCPSPFVWRVALLLAPAAPVPALFPARSGALGLFALPSFFSSPCFPLVCAFLGQGSLRRVVGAGWASLLSGLRSFPAPRCSRFVLTSRVSVRRSLALAADCHCCLPVVALPGCPSAVLLPWCPSGIRLRARSLLLEYWRGFLALFRCSPSLCTTFDFFSCGFAPWCCAVLACARSGCSFRRLARSLPALPALPFLRFPSLPPLWPMLLDWARYLVFAPACVVLGPLSWLLRFFSSRFLRFASRPFSAVGFSPVFAVCSPVWVRGFRLPLPSFLRVPLSGRAAPFDS